MQSKGKGSQIESQGREQGSYRRAKGELQGKGKNPKDMGMLWLFQVLDVLGKWKEGFRRSHLNFPPPSGGLGVGKEKVKGIISDFASPPQQMFSILAQICEP